MQCNKLMSLSILLPFHRLDKWHKASQRRQKKSLKLERKRNEHMLGIQSDGEKIGEEVKRATMGGEVKEVDEVEEESGDDEESDDDFSTFVRC